MGNGSVFVWVAGAIALNQSLPIRFDESLCDDLNSRSGIEQ